MSDSPVDNGAHISALRWAVCPGAGRVAKFGSVLVVAVPESSAQSAFVDTLLAAAEGAGSDPAGAASGLFRELSGLIIDTRVDLVAPFGVLVDEGEQIAVLLCGTVTLDIRAAGGDPERLTASGAMAYLDRRLPTQVDWLVLAGEGAAAADPGSDLRLGVATGAGLAAGARSIDEIPPDTWSPAAAVRAGGQGAPPQPARVRPQPGRPSPAATPSAQMSTFAAAEVSVAPLTAATPHHGPRNVVLVVRTMAATELTRDAIIGRQPANSPDVASGALAAVEINDASVSRVHARISITDDGVWITDLDAVNGTRLLPPSATAWNMLSPRTPTALEPGTRILFGACDAQCDFTPAGVDLVPDSLTNVQRAAGGATGPAGGIADYAFVELLGDSYHGTRYLARPPARLELDAEFVVVKVIAGITSDDAFGRAVRELRAYASVESPYLLSVHDAGNDAGRFFYSMPFVPRGSLATAADGLQVADVLRSVAHAARATHALHERGILHLGIAPSAILLGTENAYLADVGATQSIARQQTMSGLSSLQQIEFLEPEILLGGRGTPASDIWSLGATAYRSIAHVSIYGAFPDEPLLAIRTALTSKPTLPVQIDDRVMAIVRRCVDEDLTRRFASALEVAEAIEAVLPS